MKFCVPPTAIVYAKPKIVLTARDGSQLWIPVEIPAEGSGSSPFELWPDGLRVSLELGPVPPKSGKVFTSGPAFFASNSWEMLKAWFFAPNKSVVKK